MPRRRSTSKPEARKRARPKGKPQNEVPKPSKADSDRLLPSIALRDDDRLTFSLSGSCTSERRQARKAALMQAFRDAGGGNIIFVKGGKKWNVDQWENETGILLPMTMEEIAAACERSNIATAKNVTMAGYTMDAALTMLHNGLLHQGKLHYEAKTRKLATPDISGDGPGGASQITASTDEFDAFLCHASEDKQAIVEPFADAMKRAGLNPWLDKDQGKWGDGLIHRIQNGLTRSRFVVVFVSADFLGKGWPEKELETALSMEMGGRKVVLPILLGLTHLEVEGIYPMVSCKKYKEVPEYAPGKRVSKKVIAAMVDELKAFIS